MQVKDPNFSARLREYLGVAKTTSAEFQECQVPIIKERRRFTDVMEEESTTQRESRLSAWGRDDFSVYKMHSAQAVEIQVTDFTHMHEFFRAHATAKIKISGHFVLQKKVSCGMNVIFDGGNEVHFLGWFTYA